MHKYIYVYIHTHANLSTPELEALLQKRVRALQEAFAKSFPTPIKRQAPFGDLRHEAEEEADGRVSGSGFRTCALGMRVEGFGFGLCDAGFVDLLLVPTMMHQRIVFPEQAMCSVGDCVTVD